MTKRQISKIETALGNIGRKEPAGVIWITEVDGKIVDFYDQSIIYSTAEGWPAKYKELMQKEDHPWDYMEIEFIDPPAPR